jgi:putative DNA primase/helicase
MTIKKPAPGANLDTGYAAFDSLNFNTITNQFRNAIQAAGLTPPDTIEADGKLRRFASNGKRKDDAGWYSLHGDGIPAGSFGDWRTGLFQTWRADIGRTLTPAEEAAHRAKVEAMRREREAEEAKRKAEAKEKAAAIWSAAQPATEDHPYLTRKGIKANGAKLHQGALAIPMRADGILQSLQFIGPDGDKRFLTGGRVAGCYFSIGNPKGAAALCIAEGFATGASIHEATGYPVAVAFNANNLLAVAKAMRDKFPDLPLILCADDDYRTDGNPGMTKATEAARSVGGLLAVPYFGADRPDGATDFNDMAVLRGADAVKQAITSAAASVIDEDQAGNDDAPGGDTETPASDSALTESEVSEVAGVQANNHGPLAETPAGIDEVAGVAGDAASPIPDMEKRPCFCVFDDWLEHGGAKYRPGVWYFGVKESKGDAPPILTQTWVCSPLHVEAVTFDGQDNNFGRLLRFKNTLRRWREWAMPMELLRGAGDDLRGELLAMGVEIDPSAKTLLANYLQSKPPKRRMRCALQVGWCDDSFVLPDVVIGPKASGVIFQSGERGHDEHTKGGTLAGWQAEIAARAVGNPLLVIGLAASFAGPMLARCNAEGGGVHYVGDSSTGKTTAIEAACATWGGPSFRRSWRATANGMEGAAALFNDCLLALDEISECDPREVGAIVYSLGNGRGKQRAGRSGNARAVTRWRCFVLSSGERTISTTMAEGGQRAKAGQAVRLLDIPAARRFGAWDELHGAASGTAFSDALKRAAATHHGHAGRAFLEKLTRDNRDFCALLERIKSLPEFSAEGGEGQDKRAAARFALLALAGELATEYGITGWPEGEAIKAAAEGFRLWRSLRGHGNDERRQILDRVSGFIERHGDGRFSDADSNSETPIRDRAGWWRDAIETREYLFTADGMREALKGFDFNRALDALQESGALPMPGADGKRAKYYRIGGRPVRLYPVQADKLGGEHHGA